MSSQKFWFEAVREKLSGGQVADLFYQIGDIAELSETELALGEKVQAFEIAGVLLEYLAQMLGGFAKQGDRVDRVAQFRVGEVNE